VQTAATRQAVVVHVVTPRTQLNNSGVSERAEKFRESHERGRPLQGAFCPEVRCSTDTIYGMTLSYRARVNSNSAAVESCLSEAGVPCSGVCYLHRRLVPRPRYMPHLQMLQTLQLRQRALCRTSRLRSPTRKSGRRRFRKSRK